MIAAPVGGAVARSLLDARRGLGITPDELSSRSGVDLAMVARAERGDRVPPDDLGRLLDATGLDPSPVVGGIPHGPVPVPALDREHARTMTYLSDVAEVTDGWLLFPDAAAMPVWSDVEDDEIARVTARRDAWRHWGRPASLAAAAVTVSSALALMGAFALLAGAHLPGHQAGWVPLDHPIALGIYACVGGVVLGCVGMLGFVTMADGATNPHDAPLSALSGLRTFVEGQRTRVREGARLAFAVSRRGVVTYRVTPQGLVRGDHPKTSFRSVSVTEEDEGHVTVRVDTLIGPVAMPWLGRTRDLADLVAAWSANLDDAPSLLEGPQ